MIARAATAQDDIVGDGTTSNVLFIGELLSQAERFLTDGIHPRVIAEGIEMAKNRTLEFLNTCKIPFDCSREGLLRQAELSLLTKLHPKLAKILVEPITDAVLTIKREEKPIDLHMVEIMFMRHKMATDSRLVRGLVLDHGGRHPDMPSEMKNVYILTCNVSLEYEKTEVNSGFFFKDAHDREALARSERAFTDDKVMKIIDFKRKMCEGKDKTFVVINQKGIDPTSLDMLAKEGIVGLRRAKKRNMERLILACGGHAVHSVEELQEEDLGYAEEYKEVTLGDDKFTFIEGVENPFSCTILIKGPNDHTIAQLKDAIRDGLRAVKNSIDDKALIPGAGAFELAAYNHLIEYIKEVEGKPKYGVEAFAKSLLIIPGTLASNSGLDSLDCILGAIQANQKALKEQGEGEKQYFGIDLDTGDPKPVVLEKIFDNYCCKRQFLHLAPVLAQQLLLVDEIVRAGRQMKSNAPGP